MDKTVSQTPDILKPGMYMQDNDPRTNKRAVVITAVHTDPLTGQQYACYRYGYRVARVRFDRIYIDGKERRKGWNLMLTNA